jgi:hypothetical protein
MISEDDVERLVSPALLLPPNESAYLGEDFVPKRFRTCPARLVVASQRYFPTAPNAKIDSDLNSGLGLPYPVDPAQSGQACPLP